MLRAPRRLADERKAGVIRQRIDGGRLSGVGSSRKRDFRSAPPPAVATSHAAGGQKFGMMKRVRGARARRLGSARAYFRYNATFASVAVLCMHGRGAPPVFARARAAGFGDREFEKMKYRLLIVAHIDRIGLLPFSLIWRQLRQATEGVVRSPAPKPDLAKAKTDRRRSGYASRATAQTATAASPANPSIAGPARRLYYPAIGAFPERDCANRRHAGRWWQS